MFQILASLFPLQQWRQHRCVMGAVLKSQSPHTWEQWCRRNFCVVRVCNFTEGLWSKTLKGVAQVLTSYVMQQDLLWCLLNRELGSQFLLINVPCEMYLWTKSFHRMFAQCAFIELLQVPPHAILKMSCNRREFFEIDIFPLGVFSFSQFQVAQFQG